MSQKSEQGCGPGAFRSYTLTSQEARLLLQKHVQMLSDGETRPELLRVEMPQSDFLKLFNIKFPLNARVPIEESVTNSKGKEYAIWRSVANGFDRTTTPATVNFYLSVLAKIAELSFGEALVCVKNNGVSFQKTETGRDR